MTGHDDPSYAAALEQLRQRYVRSLGEKADELCLALDRYRDAGTTKELEHLVHRLAGTAGSFGVLDVSQRAALIETRMRVGTGMTPAELADEIAGLVELMRAYRY